MVETPFIVSGQLSDSSDLTSAGFKLRCLTYAQVRPLLNGAAGRGGALLILLYAWFLLQGQSCQTIASEISYSTERVSVAMYRVRDGLLSASIPLGEPQLPGVSSTGPHLGGPVRRHHPSFVLPLRSIAIESAAGYT